MERLVSWKKNGSEVLLLPNCQAFRTSNAEFRMTTKIRSILPSPSKPRLWRCACQSCYLERQLLDDSVLLRQKGRCYTDVVCPPIKALNGEVSGSTINLLSDASEAARSSYPLRNRRGGVVAPLVSCYLFFASNRTLLCLSAYVFGWPD